GREDAPGGGGAGRGLCARFGVSRKTGYKWLLRYRQRWPEGLCEQSRAPHRVPWAIAEQEAAAILGLRGAHPSWAIDGYTLKLKRSSPNARGGQPSSRFTFKKCEKVLPMLPD